MTFQDEAIAHLRKKFPTVVFEAHPDSLKPGFDPNGVGIMWEPDSKEVREEFERFMAFHQFCFGFESLTRATGIFVGGGGDWPVLYQCDGGKAPEGFSYKIIDEIGHILWRPKESS